MTLIKFKNTPSLFDRYSTMPSVFSDFFNDFMNEEVVPRNVFKSVPAVNISETPDHFHIELAAPGMKKEDFKIQVENGVLSIGAEKKEEKQEGDAKYTRKEFSYTSFSRSFTMPEHVNPEGILAEYTNGVLKLDLPKKDELKKKPVREIPVN